MSEGSAKSRRYWKLQHGKLRMIAQVAEFWQKVSLKEKHVGGALVGKLCSRLGHAFPPPTHDPLGAKQKLFRRSAE